MAIERVQRQGWFSRIKSAFAGIFVGLILVVVAGGLQFWNEGRTLRQQRLLDAGRAETVALDPARSADFSGRLVHYSAELAAAGERLDPEFNQVAEGLGLRREVEMYQWKERKETREETSVGGSKTTRTTYHYEQTWADQPIDHRRFEQPSGHENPGALPFEARTWRADDVRLGEFPLASEVVGEIGGWRPMAPDLSRLPPNLAASFRQDAEYLTTQAGSAAIGDVRIRFQRLPAGPLSLVARFENGQLQTERREQGELLLLERGDHDATALFDAAERRNAGLGWALRAGGFVLMWVGFGLLFAPLAVLSDVIPLFGKLTRFVNAILSGTLAATISFVAIASGWLFHRPWLLGGFLIVLAAAIVLLLRRRSSAAPAPPAMPPPPPMP